MKPCPKPVKKKKRKAAAVGKVKKLDGLVRSFILARDKACVLCGSTEVVQWSHLITRRKWRTRWDPYNSVAMCRSCHARHHKQGPEEYTLWFLQKYGVAEYESLCFIAKAPITSAERRELIDRMLEHYQ